MRRRERRDLCEIERERRRSRAEEDVNDFVFGEAVGQSGAVARAEGVTQLGTRAEFFAEAAACRRKCALTRARVTAAGIRPQPAGVILGATALLEQHAAIGLDEEDGKRPVPQARLVHRPFFRAADGAVAPVHEDQVFAHAFDDGPFHFVMARSAATRPSI